MYLTHRWDSKGTTTSSLSGPESNGNEGVLHTAYELILMVRVGWLFGFYGISTFVGHSTPNSVYIYIHIQPKISKRILR